MTNKHLSTAILAGALLGATDWNNPLKKPNFHWMKSKCKKAKRKIAISKASRKRNRK